MVAGIKLLASRASPDGFLFLCLDDFGPCEKTPGGNVVQYEGEIVAAPAELGIVVRLADQGVVRLEYILDRNGARWDSNRRLEARFVTVIHHEDVVG